VQGVGCFVLIYLLYNAVTSKYYVGKTEKTLAERWKGHVKFARLRKRGCSYLWNAIRHDGAAAFEQIVLADGVQSREELDNLECLWIAALDSTNPSIGYNLTFGGQGGVQTAEVRAQMSAACIAAGNGKCLRGRKIGPHTEERKANIAKALLGSHLSEEHKDAIRKGGKGKQSGEKNPMCRLTDLQVRDMREHFERGEKMHSLAKRFGVHYQTVYRIVHCLRRG